MIWSEGSFRVFLSHTHPHRGFANALRSRLAEHRLDAFVAHTDIAPTTEWMGDLRAALESADALIALMSGDFHDSLWTDQEVGWALGRGIPIVPVKMDASPYGLLGTLQAVELPRSPTAEEAAAPILEAMLLAGSGNPRLGDALVTAFARSSSHSQARAHFRVLEQAHVLTREQCDRLASLFLDSPNLRDTSLVRHNMEDLLAKHGYSMRRHPRFGTRPQGPPSF